MWTSSWQRNRISKRARRMQRPQAALRFRPRLEALEDRTLLSGTDLYTLTQVSGADPITNNNDQPSTQRGTVYYNSAVEPQVAVDPNHPNIAVAVWMQDRWSTGGARALVASVTFDANTMDSKGPDWSTPVVIPGISATSEDPNNIDYLRASDPWVSIGPGPNNTETVYISALSATLGADIPVPADTAIKAITARLVNPTNENPTGGLSFGTAQNLISNTSPFPLDELDDKESITADPYQSGVAYAVWDQLDFPSDQVALDAYHAGAAIRENIFFSMTSDGGQTWSPAQNITNFLDLHAMFANQIVVEPDGTLVDIGTLINGSGSQPPAVGQVTLAALRSTDGGQTWSAPITGPAIEAIGITDPNTGQHVRDGEAITDVTVDPSNGNLYAVWADGRFSNFTHEDIAFSMSTDGGLHWSDPIKVNQTPTEINGVAIPAGDQQAFTPSVAVAANGTVAVSYYDFRNNGTIPGLATDYWLVQGNPAGTGGLLSPNNWGNEVRLTNSSFNLENAPSAGGLFVGDYEGLSAGGADGNSFYALFSQVSPGASAGTADVYFRDPPPAATLLPTTVGPAPSAALPVNPPALGSPADAGSSVQPAWPSLLPSLLAEVKQEWDSLVESVLQEWRVEWLDLLDLILAAEGASGPES